MENGRGKQASKQANKQNRVILRNALSRGFTALEIVVTVVILSILAAYATPKLFGLKDQADEVQETMKIQDLASKHAKEMLEQGKRNGALPTLGGTVGFREPVVAETAPDTAPVLVDWRFENLSSYSMNQNRTGLSDTHFYDTYDLEPVYLYRQNMLNLGQDMLCDRSASMFNPKYAADGRYVHGTVFPSKYGIEFLSSDFSMSRSGNVEDVPITESAPKCSMSLRFKTISDSSSGDLFDAPWNTRGFLYEYIYTPTTKQQIRILPNGSTIPGAVSTQSWQHSSSYNYQATPTANVFRLDCSSHSARYSAPYIVKNSTWTTGGTLNGAETSGWRTLSVTSLPAASVVQTSTTPVMKDITINLAAHWPATNWGVCERQGPAPTPPPSDPGDPGAYPMAADGSGYCLGTGRKLPTYRDGNDTPTSSASDPVAELGTEAVDDATNCP